MLYCSSQSNKPKTQFSYLTRMMMLSRLRISCKNAVLSHGKQHFSSSGPGKPGLLHRVQSHQFLDTEAFTEWRRRHTVFLVSAGVVIGAGLFGTGLYIYVDRHPKAMEFFVVERSARAFDAALSFESRHKVYSSLPDIVLPQIEDVFFKAVETWLHSVSQNSNGAAQKISAESILINWADLIDDSFNKANSSWMITAKTVMRGKLVEEIVKLPTIEQRIQGILDIMPNSVERDLMISDQIEAHIESGEFFPAAMLEKLRPQSPEESCDIRTRLLINAIAFFPGPINRLIHFLQSPLPDEFEDDAYGFVSSTVDALSEMVMSEDALSEGEMVSLQRRSSTRLLESTGLVHSTLEKTLLRMKMIYDELPPSVQNFVFHSALTTAITNLRDLPSIGGFRPYDLYVTAIDHDLIGPLRRDARISEDILQEVKTIFLAVPGDIQARVLLTAILHPSTAKKIDDFTHEDASMLVRDLLSSGGVVAVKLAQMLAEHPKIPRDYQIMLGSLRDDNKPMHPTAFWFQVPSAVRSKIVGLGGCLGTGSVKQANRAKFKSGNEYAVVVLRSGVEDEALSSIGAMETSDELGPVARQLGRLVYGEFNLFGEGEVVQEFAGTQIGTHPLFHVVRVRHHSPKCLVEEIAAGPSVGHVLESLDDTPEAELEKKRTLDILLEYHKTIMAAFIRDGLIHSDIHLGNATKSMIEDGEGGEREGFMLFDIGQFERIGVPDRKAILWTLSAITPKMRELLRPVAIAHLSATASLKDKTISDEVQQRKMLREKLDSAFGEAIEPMSDGEIPDQRTAYMLFLRAAERNGVEMPKGAFSVAKMIDGIVSQQERYNLPVVVDDQIEMFLKSTMTWGEFADIGARKLKVK